jgi:hypothetical protein
MSTNFEIDHEAHELFGMAMAYAEEIADAEAESRPVEELDENSDHFEDIKAIARKISLKEKGPSGNAFVDWVADVNTGKIDVASKVEVLGLRVDDVF